MTRSPLCSAWSALLFLLMAACAHQAAPPEPAPSQRASTPSPGLFLYSVEREGQVSHVLGTMHLGFGLDEVMTPAARASLEQANVVITETDVGSDAAERMMRAAMLPPDQSLRALLDDATWHALVARLGSQLPEPVLMRLRPWLPAVLLGIMDLTRAFEELRPGKSAHMMDVELIELAKRGHKELQYLESVDEQIAVFEDISIEEQIAELKHALTDDSSAQSRALVSAFASGDEEALTRTLFDGDQLAAAPGFYKAVLFDRNARWLPMLDRALGRGNTFVAVGAAHLFGDSGLLAELSRRGYRVSRVY